jgi:5-methylcytosine-specific restriction endonuclease McrA
VSRYVTGEYRDVKESTVEIRKCKQCGEEKVLNEENFTPRKYKTTQFFDGVCRACTNEYRRLWMRQNRSRYDDKEAAWYAENRERLLAAARDAYRTDPAVRAEKSERAKVRYSGMTEEQRAAGNNQARERYYRDVEKSRSYAKKFAREWRKNNLDKSRLSAHKQRAIRRGAQVETITKKQIEELFEKQRGRCAICTSKIDMVTKHIDHIAAIAKGGKHEILNLQLTCPRCNMSKHDKHPIDHMQKLGYLL